mgnify:CR=1 FL=1
MPQFSTLSRYGIGKRYGLAPVWAQQRKPGSQQKKKRARAPAKKAEWNAYLTDAGRYKLPAKEVERRKKTRAEEVARAAELRARRRAARRARAVVARWLAARTLPSARLRGRGAYKRMPVLRRPRAARRAARRHRGGARRGRGAR